MSLSVLLRQRSRSNFRFQYVDKIVERQGCASLFHSECDKNGNNETHNFPSKRVLSSDASMKFRPLGISPRPLAFSKGLGLFKAGPKSISSHQGMGAPLVENEREFYTISNSRSNWMRYINDPETRMTNALMAANILAYVLLQYDHNYIMQNYALIPMALLRSGEWYRLVTSGFLHHGLLHLLGNMFSLRWLAPEVERQSGALRTALIYLVSAAGGSYMHYLFGPSFVITCGCSGSIAGFFGAYVVMKLQNRHFLGFGQDTVLFILQVIGINALLSLALGGSIAHWAHLGGLLSGSMFMFLFGPRFRWAQGYVEDRPLIGWFRDRS